MGDEDSARSPRPCGAFGLVSPARHSSGEHDAAYAPARPELHLHGPLSRRQSRDLLSVPNYDFNWQSVYRLAEPKPLPAGTTIECEAHFDNSAA